MAKDGGDDVDPVTTSALSALGKAIDPAGKEGAVVGGKLALNLFGPVTEELGVILRDRVHSRFVVDVVQRAERKQRTKSQKEGAIPLRAAKAVLDAAQVADNEFVAEYLSGVLASARTVLGTDDSAVTWTALVQRLSAAQLRLHYALCMIFRVVAANEDRSVTYLALQKQIAIPVPVIAAFMGDQWDGVKTLESLYGLQAERLIGERLTHGPQDFVNRILGNVRALPQQWPSDWWVLNLTERSIGLFLHAFGYGDNWIQAALEPERDFSLPESADADPAVLVGYFVDDLLAATSE